MTEPYQSLLRRSLAPFIAVAACVFVGCSQDPVEPTLDKFEEHTIDLSGHKVVFSVPADGVMPPPTGYIRDWNYLKPNVDFNNETQRPHGEWEYGGWSLAERHWKWKSIDGYGGVVVFFIDVLDVSESVQEEGDTLASRFARDHRHRYDTARSGGCGNRAGFRPARIKDAVRFEPSDVTWLRHDYYSPHSYDRREDFAFPLDNKHVLVFRFVFFDYDYDVARSENEDQEIGDDSPYPQMEIIADEIMKSVSITLKGEAPEIPYGVPDHGDVTGKVRYHDDLSQRSDPFEM